MGRKYTTTTIGGRSITASWAAGLKLRDSSKVFMFSELENGDRPIAIGRDGHCQIKVKDTSVSGVHALIERDEDAHYLIRDSGSTNGVVIEGDLATKPTVLMAAMRIDLGHATFIAVDEHGMVPILARSICEFCYLLFVLWGSYREAARHCDMDREFIRTHAERWQNQEIMGL